METRGPAKAHLDSHGLRRYLISDEIPPEVVVRTRIWLVAALILVADVAAPFAQCLKMDGYQVVAVDRKTSRFIFHHGQFDRSGHFVLKRIVTECHSALFRGENTTDIPKAPPTCGASIFTGLMFPTVQESIDAPRARVIEFDDLLSVVMGHEPDQVVNRFRIVSVEVLSNSTCN
jgi:hypothetical protein